MAAHQCPRCPLRFSFRTELEFHLREDHDRGQHAQGTGFAGEPVMAGQLVHPNGSGPEELGAATMTALMPSPRSSLLPSAADRSPSPDITLAAGTPDGKARGGVHRSARALPPVTLMPRWVVVAVIALVVMVLGLGIIFGS